MAASAIEFYQRWISPTLHAISGTGGACRFQPTCSEYAAAALERHGALRGSGLALWRLLRCNPFCHGGFDPVPGTYSEDELFPADASRFTPADAGVYGDLRQGKLAGANGTVAARESVNGENDRGNLIFPS